MHEQFDNPTMSPYGLAIRSWWTVENHHDVKVGSRCSTRSQNSTRQECSATLGKQLVNDPRRGNDWLFDVHDFIMFRIHRLHANLTQRTSLSLGTWWRTGQCLQNLLKVDANDLAADLTQDRSPRH